MSENILSLTATPYIAGSGNPDTAYEVVSTTAGAYSPYAPGDLGKMFVSGDKVYKKVALDAGAVVMAIGQLLYWKDKPNSVVTNNIADAALGVSEEFPDGQPDSYRNNVAGLVRGIVPVNSQFFMLVHGISVPVLEHGAATPGMRLVADAPSADPDVATVALGLPIGTPMTHQDLGTVTVATVDGTCMADFDVMNG